MPPYSSWSSTSNKSEIKMSSVEIGWKNLMNECLMETEIFKKDENKNKTLLLVDPISTMDLRHRMVKQSTNVVPMPQALIHTEAMKLLRMENHDRLLKQKEGKIVEKEISKFKQLLENHRHFTKEKINETVKKKSKSLTSIQKFSKITTSHKKQELEGLDRIYKVNSWQSHCVPLKMESSQHGYCAASHNVRLALKNKEERLMKDKYSESVFIQKDSIIDKCKPEHNKCSLQEIECKNKIFKEFLKADRLEVNHKLQDDVEEEEKIKKNSDIQNLINQKKMKRAWEAWKAYTKKLKSREKEKIIYNNKIDLFFIKLKEKDIRGKKAQELKCIMNLKEIKANSTLKNRLHKIKEEMKVEEKEERLKKLWQEIKTSQTETSQKLQEITKIRSENQSKFSEVKFFKRMEERREERLKRRKEINEKKRKKDEEREKAEKEKEEEKRRQEEEHKRKSLEKFKEERRLEKMRKEEREKKREELNLKMKLAEKHYEVYLLRSFGLRPWAALMEIRESQNQLALAFHTGKLVQKIFLKWATFVRDQVAIRVMHAEEFYKKVLKRKYLLIWIQFRKEKIKQNQVAVDWNEFRITERAFKKWLHFTYEEHMDYLNKKDIVNLIYERKLLQKYLKKLKDYPELKKLQQAKENQKRKWRQKVREILPDYRPVGISEKV